MFPLNQTTLPDGKVMTLGVRQVAGGDADTYFDCFNEIIDDIASACRDQTSTTRAELITSFKSFMNDRYSNIAVNNCKSHLIYQKKILDKLFYPN